MAINKQIEDIIISIINEKDVMLFRNKVLNESICLVCKSDDWSTIADQLDENISTLKDITLNMVTYSELEYFVRIGETDSLAFFLGNAWELIYDKEDRFLDFQDLIDEEPVDNYNELYEVLRENALETSNEISNNLAELILLIENYNLRFKQLFKIEQLNGKTMKDKEAFFNYMLNETYGLDDNSLYVKEVYDLMDVTYMMMGEDQDNNMLLKHINNALQLHYVLKGLLEGGESDGSE